jgi:hypothetical protein
MEEGTVFEETALEDSLPSLNDEEALRELEGEGEEAPHMHETDIPSFGLSAHFFRA